MLETYGTITLGQGLSFAADLKLGHYAKIPPRTLFAAQLTGTVISAFMSLGVTNWQINNVKDFCKQNQPEKFSCPGVNGFFTSSVIWGVIGPKYNYGTGGIYNILMWGFLMGLVIPVPFYLAAKRWPHSWLTKIHPMIVLAGFTMWAPINLSYISAAVPVGYIFNVHLKKRFPAWWSKYNYITATGLSTGIAIAGLVAFVALQNPGIELDWIGNVSRTSSVTCSQSDGIEYQRCRL